MVTGGARTSGVEILPVSLPGFVRQMRVAIKRASITSPEGPESRVLQPSNDRRVRRWAVGLTSLAFIVLQSACTVIMALSGLRLAMGLGALAAAAVGVKGPATGFHQDAIRIPMMILAVAGSVINLYMIWRIRSLRKKASSQWRRQPISSRRLWGERVQLTLAVVTLVLVLAEFLSHQYVFRLVG